MVHANAGAARRTQHREEEALYRTEQPSFRRRDGRGTCQPRSDPKGTGSDWGPRHPDARKTSSLTEVQPTLRQAWPQEDLGPQCAFKILMFNVSCNSH